MKLREEKLFLGTLLLAVVAVFSLPRALAPKKADGAPGACCPLVQLLNAMSSGTRTDNPIPVAGTNIQPNFHKP